MDTCFFRIERISLHYVQTKKNEAMRFVTFFTVSLLVSLTCISCFPGSTRFSNKEIQIGSTKAAILEKYGRPFKENIQMEKGDTIEVLSYKEELFYDWNSYIVTTNFYFKNSRLFKKEQSDELLQEATGRNKNININIDQK